MIKKLIITIFLLFGIVNTVFAENFYIKNYDINLDVKEDRTIHIEENIDTFFTNSSHGIFRKIPIINNIVRANGSKKTVEAQISNVSVSEMNSQYKNSGNYIIKIGDPNTLISGEHRYRINYDYKLLYNSNEFYFNIIGDGWDTNINNVRFKVRMPKSFDPNKVGISVGRYGTKGFNGDLKYSINPRANTIEGYSLRPLNNHEAITIRIEVPEGYFLKIDTTNPVVNLCYFLIIIFALASFLKWYFFGKDDTAIPVVNFYPPKNLTSAQVGVIHKGTSEIEQVTSLIIYLASKGYLKIKGESAFFEIEKLKEYDEEDLSCKMLMKALFRETSSTIVTSQDLKYSETFYQECQDIMKQLDEINKKTYNKDSISFSAKIIPIISIIAISVILILGIYDFNLFSGNAPLFILLFPIIAILVFTLFWQSGSWSKRIFATIWALGFGGMPLSIIVGENLYSVSKNILLIITAIIGITISAICLYQMPKRNRRGLRLLGNILGFKKFLETAESSRIRALAKENPLYCFDMLPYAYVLGVYEGWIKIMKDIMIPAPQWWEGGFNAHNFSRTMNHICDVSTPSTSNGGISSSSSSGGGGGCSGGGGGGGGGGSW